MHRSYTFSLQIKYSCTTLLSLVLRVELELHMPHTHLHESFNTVYLHTLIVAIMESTRMQVTRQRYVWMHIHIRTKKKTPLVWWINEGVSICVQQWPGWNPVPRRHMRVHGSMWVQVKLNRKRSNLEGVAYWRWRNACTLWGQWPFVVLEEAPPTPPSIKQENWCVSLIMPVYHKSSLAAVINYFLPLQRTWQSRDE